MRKALSLFIKNTFYLIHLASGDCFIPDDLKVCDWYTGKWWQDWSIICIVISVKSQSAACSLRMILFDS